ncbi:carbonic anhydrase family protein [Nocardioides sp. CFH 31398]|uniref:carbonic anhydrase family protein n=1 Tax=Nocardioides sp. CFH 31398 TaxID=2919579 RepID=UPI001F065612|nr:carbonic anhydrase family protein [Nocardioides sp. CFH 31398]MCH1865797.1 carbonic anhydrase family protein [Nocardioides sp. CFH 31398]
MTHDSRTTSSLHDRRALLRGAAGLGACAALAPLLGGSPGTAAWAGLTTAGGGDGDDRRQSPIDIRTDRVARAPGFPPLVVDYPSSESVDLVYVNRDGEDGCEERAEDETVQAQNLSRRAVVRRDGETWRLLQTHFHITSEHRVDGRAFPMEQHFVHERTTDGALLVIGVFLVPGGHGPQDRLLARLPEECDDDPIRVRGLDLSRMLPASLSSWTYRGSLTTAPYTQGVTWHVMREPRAIEEATIRRFRRLFEEGDSRGPQPLNGRVVRQVRGRRA